MKLEPGQYWIFEFLNQTLIEHITGPKGVHGTRSWCACISKTGFRDYDKGWVSREFLSDVDAELIEEKQAIAYILGLEKIPDHITQEKPRENS